MSINRITQYLPPEPTPEERSREVLRGMVEATYATLREQFVRDSVLTFTALRERCEKSLQRGCVRVLTEMRERHGCDTFEALAAAHADAVSRILDFHDKALADFRKQFQSLVWDLAQTRNHSEGDGR